MNECGSYLSSRQWPYIIIYSWGLLMDYCYLESIVHLLFVAHVDYEDGRKVMHPRLADDFPSGWD